MNKVTIIEEKIGQTLRETLTEMINNKSKSEILFWTPPTSMSLFHTVVLQKKKEAGGRFKILRENKKMFVIQRKYNIDVFLNGVPFYIMIQEPITADGRQTMNIDRIGLQFDTPISVLGIIYVFTRKANRDEAYRYIYS